ncbi:MAG TPA: amino acid adenylation domain-containing protein [Ruminococcus sp.]|nr:amino acid adenylation domain-containing protein [Ruminococcus sp.]
MDVSNPLLTDIDIIPYKEKQLILNDFNATETEYPRDKTVVELFEEQVKKTPDNTALVFGDKKLTYAELNARANSLAHRLRELGVKPDDFVAIIADKSIEIIEGIYGIIKAGGAYLPIDPTYPEDRIAFILEDSAAKVVLKFTDEPLNIPADLTVIDLSDEKVWNGNSSDPETVNKPEDAIYCIYTSGTTGKPKGVVVEHHNVVKLVMNCDYTELNEESVILQTGQLMFDASTFEVWGASLNGGTLHLISKENMLNAATFKNYLIDNKVNTLFITTALFNQFIGEDKTIFNSLKHLMFGGEATSERHVEMLRSQNTDVDFRNVYGPTETTTFAAHYIIKEKVDKTPIGKPISNTQMYVLNGNELCGIGVPGELCIAGDGLARGYLNRPELTAEKFVKNPFGEGRMYRTGDLARWLPDGNIEFLGRIDEQVKIHGFRIELGEIETRIRDIENIKDCAVIAREDSTGDKAIYAYYTSDNEVSVSEIRDRLSESLPEYMVPAYMMQIESIPVTRNGKLDKRALPEIESRAAREYAAPRNEAERAVCQAFSEILNVERVGVQDSFFELGGDSIKAIRIISKLRNAGYTATVKDVMNGKTVDKIALVVKEANDKQKYEQAEVTGKVESTPIIKEFGEWNLAKPEHFNQSMMFPVDRIANDIIHSAIEELVKHHDVLRAVYRGKVLEIMPIAESKLLDFYEFDYSSEVDKKLAVAEKCTEIQSSIDLENGPLVKTAVFELGDTKQMMFCIHHLAVDGVSWRILQEDFETAVSQLKEGKEVKLPEKTASFIEWSKKLKEYGEQIGRKEKEYWKRINSKIREGKIKGDYAEEKAGFAVVEFSKETTEKLLTKSSNAFGAKIDEVLLAGLARAVGRVTGQKSVAIKLEGHGREEIHETISIDRTVGWFTNVYAVSLECSEDNERSIINAKDTVRSVLNMGMGFGYVEHETMPDICFNYLGDFSGNKTSFISEYSTGNDVSTENKLEEKVILNGQVSEEKLRF